MSNPRPQKKTVIITFEVTIPFPTIGETSSGKEASMEISWYLE
jgi:hypothetical protein